MDRLNKRLAFGMNSRMACCTKVAKDAKSCATAERSIFPLGLTNAINLLRFKCEIVPQALRLVGSRSQTSTHCSGGSRVKRVDFSARDTKDVLDCQSDRVAVLCVLHGPFAPHTLIFACIDEAPDTSRHKGGSRGRSLRVVPGKTSTCSSQYRVRFGSKEFVW